MTDPTHDGSVKTSERNSSFAVKPIFVMGVLAVFILLGATVSFLNKDSGPLSAASLSGNSNASRLSDEAVSAYSPLSPSNQELLSSVPGLVKGQGDISQRISSLAVSVGELTRNLADHKAEMETTLFAKFQALDQQSINSVEMQAQLTSLNQQLKTLNDDVSDLAKKLTSKSKSSAKPVIMKKSIPPFNLLSVQVWNSNPVAIVSHNNSQISIGVRDSLAGWTVTSISDSGCMDVSQTNEMVKLCL